MLVQVPRSDQAPLFGFQSPPPGSIPPSFVPWMSPRHGTSSPMPQGVPLSQAASPAANDAYRVPWSTEQVFNGTPSIVPPFQNHRQQNNSVPDLILPPWQLPGAQRLQGKPPPLPSSAHPSSRQQAPVRMLSAGTQALVDAQNLSAGPQVDWDGVEERWLRGDLTEGKVRAWLATIPMSDGNDRDWDDAQVLNLVQFAQEYGVGHLPAEEIYRLYVMRQVELADSSCW